MKKIIFIYVILIVAVVVLAIAQRNSFNFLTFNRTATATVANQKFDVILAKSQDERIKGLSDRDKIPDNQGMLFVFDKKDKHGFWMKNMRFPIDIIYIDTNTIVDIVSNAQPPKDKNATNLPIYTPDKAANYVLEINSNLAKKYKFKTGDKVTFSNL